MLPPTQLGRTELLPQRIADGCVGEIGEAIYLQPDHLLLDARCIEGGEGTVARRVAAVGEDNQAWIDGDGFPCELIGGEGCVDQGGAAVQAIAGGATCRWGCVSGDGGMETEDLLVIASDGGGARSGILELSRSGTWIELYVPITGKVRTSGDGGFELFMEQQRTVVAELTGEGGEGCGGGEMNRQSLGGVKRKACEGIVGVASVEVQGLPSPACGIGDGERMLRSRVGEGGGERITTRAIAVAVEELAGRGRDQAIRAGVMVVSINSALMASSLMDAETRSINVEPTSASAFTSRLSVAMDPDPGGRGEVPAQEMAT